MSEASGHKLSITVKSMYGTGAVADVLVANLIAVMAMPLYVEGLGISSVLLGWALLIPRFLDSLFDPLIGYLSDNTRLRWGRRRPYMFIGAILGGLFCGLLWVPPGDLGNTGVFIYFLLVSILYWLAYSIYSVPFNALGYELSGDYDERTSVMSYKTFFMNAGSAFVMPWVLWLCMRPVFGGTLVQGARIVGFLVGACVALFGIVAAVACKERFHHQSKIGILTAFKYTLSNKVFLLLAFIVVCVLVGVLSVFPLIYFVNLSYIFPNDPGRTATYWGLYQTTYGIAGLLGIPVINYLGQRFGKKPILMVGLVLVSLMFPASWLLFNPVYPWLQLIFAALVSPGLSFVFVLTSAMMADVCDLDQFKTGVRREGMYGSVFTLLIKIGVSCVGLVTGYALTFSGYVPKAEMQTPDSIFNLRLFFVFLPIAFLLTAMILACLYPLSKKKMEEIRLQLDGQPTTENHMNEDKDAEVS